MKLFFRSFLLFFSLFLGMGISGGSFAQENDSSCLTGNLSLVGTTQYLVGEDVSLVPTQIVSGSTITHSLYYGDTLIKKQYHEEFKYQPKKAGTYRLQTVITSDICSQTIETPLSVYQDVIIIIGKIDTKLLEPYAGIFTQQSVFVHVIPFPSNNVTQNLVDHISKIKYSKNIIISTNAVDDILSRLTHLSTSSQVNFKDKNITILNTMNRNLMKRILSKYMKYFSPQKVYTTDKNNFLNLIASLSTKEDIAESKYLTLFSLSESETPSYLFLSRMVDALIYHGFPIGLIGLLLTVSLAVLAVTIFRQVIGFDIFGSYTPLMVGLSVYILGFHLSLLLFAFAFLATIIVRIFTKKIYLLYSAKVSLLISLYFVFIFIGLSYSQTLLANFINFALFSNMFVVFPMLLIILVSEKIFYEGFKVLSKGWWISVIEFSIVSFVVYVIIHSIYIQNFMLSYPEIIIAIVLLIVLVGRFSGLQLLEYFRFYNLFGKQQDDEEE